MHLTLDRLAYLLSDLVAEIIEIDGYLFIDRMNAGEEGLKSEIAKYTSSAEAQSWLNIAPLSEVISEILNDDWALDDPGIGVFLSLFEKSWAHQIAAKFPSRRFKIVRWRDDENGDIGLRLLQAGVCKQTPG